ncbi:MAG: glycosyltransferase family 25 protein, partial [Acetobacteraceae bacterium]
MINLPERTDRRCEIEVELGRIGLGPDDPLVQVFPAVRPAERGEFESIGARGCFLSHLEVLRDAVAKGYRSILILEDDVDWTSAALSEGAGELLASDWAFLHGGPGNDAVAGKGIGLARLVPGQDVRLTHFIGLRGEIIARLVAYLQAMLTRPAGSPEGGPMHVDGAYSWFRRAHPEVDARVCVPSVARQRSSRSDIFQHRGWRASRPADWARRLLRRVQAL